MKTGNGNWKLKTEMETQPLSLASFPGFYHSQAFTTPSCSIMCDCLVFLTWVCRSLCSHSIIGYPYLVTAKQAHVRMKSSKTSRIRWESHHNIFAPSLPTFTHGQILTPTFYRMSPLQAMVDWHQKSFLCSLTILTHLWSCVEILKPSSSIQLL